METVLPTRTYHPSSRAPAPRTLSPSTQQRTPMGQEPLSRFTTTRCFLPVPRSCAFFCRQHSRFHVAQGFIVQYSTFTTRLHLSLSPLPTVLNFTQIYRGLFIFASTKTSSKPQPFSQMPRTVKPHTLFRPFSTEAPQAPSRARSSSNLKALSASILKLSPYA